MQRANEIEKLYNRVVALHGDIDTIRQPLVDIKSVIDEIKKLLDLPGSVAKDLKKLRTLVSAIDEVMQLLEWIPGEFGTTCKTVHNLLSPLVAPRNKAILDKLIKATEDMDKAAQKIKTYLQKIEPLIDKALKEINTVRDKVIDLETTLAELVEHYKRIPPSEETVACVRALNNYIDQFEKAVQGIREKFEQAIQPLNKVLQDIKNYLEPIATVAEQISNLLKQLDIEPVNELIRQVNKYKKKIEEFRKTVMSKVEALVKKAFKQFGIDIDAIDRMLKKLIDSALRPLRNMIDQIVKTVNGMLDQITTTLAKMLPIDQLQKILSRLESLRDELERELDELAGTVCKSVLKV